MKAAVISGGGALGACGGGTLSSLHKDYQIVSGVSTGSLLAPLVALKEYARLKEAYTSVTQKDIFDYNPFTCDGKIHIPKAVWRIVNGKTTLGESLNLRKTIDRFLSDEDLLELKRRKKQVIVACQETSVSPEQIYHFSSLHLAPVDFKDFMWASANAPFVMSILQKGGREWTDGGLTELLSLKKVIEMGATEIDVIIHRVKPAIYEKGKVKNLFHNAARLFDIMRKEVEGNDLTEGLLRAQHKEVKVNVYWLPKKLASNSLIFDKKQMNEWWHLGYQTAFDRNRIDCYDFTTAPIL